MWPKRRHGFVQEATLRRFFQRAFSITKGFHSGARFDIGKSLPLLSLTLVHLFTDADNSWKANLMIVMPFEAQGNPVYIPTIDRLRFLMLRCNVLASQHDSLVKCLNR